MCGLFGVAGRRDHTGLRDAALTLRHRGPDGFGEWASATAPVYLAHCRLAIIDLSEAGRQPMANADGSIQITYNGEIYNFRELRTELEAAGHRFQSHTDTETIVLGYQQWGEGIVERLRGIFAFAIWDSRKGKLLLARDRLGVKPLYYALRGGELAFASETRALLAASPSLRAASPPALVQFLHHGYIQGSQSAWQGIHRLPPATMMTFDVATGATTLTRYWSKPVIDSSTSATDALSELTALLDDAVREELVADVPVGCFLSGGLDSSLVSSFAAAHSPRIRTYFADFEGWQGSERGDAQRVAEWLGTNHHVENIGGLFTGSGGADEGDVFDAYDEPNGDEAIIPTWHLSRAISRHVKVALSGDGGDELFAGYKRYAAIMPTPRRRLAWQVEAMRRRFGLGRQWPQGCAGSGEYFRFLMAPAFSSDELHALFPAWRDAIDAGSPDRENDAARARRDVRDWQLMDIDTYLVDNNLARMDRGSMAHGLEVRVPMLDHRIVELALALPAPLNPASEGGKLLLRRIAGQRLPRELLDKPKQGFSFPLQRYIRLDQMASAVSAGVLVENDLLDRQALSAWLAAAQGGNHPLKLWLLYVMEQWAVRWLFPARKAA